MYDEITDPQHAPLTFDEVGARLAALRQQQGRPSYAEIAARIAARRAAQGVAPARARVARSTVYDVFRPGRKRLDVSLVQEILLALDLPEATVRTWTERAAHAVAGVAHAPRTDPQDRAPEEGPEEGPEATPEPTDDPTDDPAGNPAGGPVAAARTARRTALLLLACLVLNLVGRELVVVLGLPLHLDMTGTAVAAVMAGPWWGALVGVATNGAGAASSGLMSLPFALVNVAGALVWGYGVHRWGMGRTIPRYFTLSVIAGLVCSCVATPILVISQGSVVHGSDTVLANAAAVVPVVVVGTFLGNLLISLADKTISGAVALIVAESRSPRATYLALGGGGAEQPLR